MPVYLIFVAVMFLMTLPLLKYNMILFYIGLGITIVALVAVFILTLGFRDYVKKVVSSVTKSIIKVPDGYLESLKMAAAVVGEHGEILLYNKKFKSLFFKSSDGLNENISKYLVDDTIESLTMSMGGVDTEFNGKKLTVYSSKVSRGFLLTVVDNFRPVLTHIESALFAVPQYPELRRRNFENFTVHHQCSSTQHQCTDNFTHLHNKTSFCC